MTIRTILGTLTVGLCAAVLTACGGGDDKDAKGGGKDQSQTQKTYVIGVVAKSQSNKIFIPTRTGADDAARDLSKRLGIEVQIRWQTPPTEDAEAQARYIEQLANECDGIAVSVSNANTLTPIINEVVGRGVPVVTFDSDAPDSARFAYFGTDNYEAGRQLMDELVKAMPDGGAVAVLTGSINAPNLNARVRGVTDVIDEHENITLQKVYDNPSEDAKRAVEIIEQAQGANPQIAGWAMVGGWALYTDNALDKIKGKAVVVSLDAMPSQLPYLERAEVATLLGQKSYDWGYRTVELLVEKLHNGETPADPIVKSELIPVTPDTVEAYRAQLAKWGLDGG